MFIASSSSNVRDDNSVSKSKCSKSNANAEKCCWMQNDDHDGGDAHESEIRMVMYSVACLVVLKIKWHARNRKKNRNWRSATGKKMKYTQKRNFILNLWFAGVHTSSLSLSVCIIAIHSNYTILSSVINDALIMDYNFSIPYVLQHRAEFFACFAFSVRFFFSALAWSG